MAIIYAINNDNVIIIYLIFIMIFCKTVDYCKPSVGILGFYLS